MMTARPEVLRAQTELYHDLHLEGLFQEIIMVGNPYDNEIWRHKADVCLELGIVAITDDSLSTLIRAHECGIHSIRYGNYGWNRHRDELGEEIPLPEGMDHADDMLAVEAILEARYCTKEGL
jgi:hypothetical protein